MLRPEEYLKAIVGAVLAGLTTLATALVDDGVTAQEWISVLLSIVATFTLVFRVPNKKRGGRVQS